MRTILSFLLALCVSIPSFLLAQNAPQKMNYQAVARTADGAVIADKEVGLRIAIVSSDNMERPVYAEEHLATTNKLGLMNLQIGTGEVLEGSMETIDWGGSAHYLKIFLDADNIDRFVEMGTSQLLTVPYAFYAERSGSSEDGGNRSDPNDWTINGNTGTDDATNFLGTTDAQDLVFKTNGVEAGRFNQTGQLALPISSDITIGGANALSMDGTRNIHIGQNAGAISTGNQNAFIGYRAGYLNTSGVKNTFIGPTAGRLNTTGSQNAFVGGRTGFNNTEGNQNSFIGWLAGQQNTTGNENTFIGKYAGLSNATGSLNTYIGSNAYGTTDLTNATAIGAGASVTQDSSVVLGNNANVGIGTSAPGYDLDVAGDINFTGTLYENGVPFSGGAFGVTGTTGQTIYHDGTDWLNTSSLTNNGVTVSTSADALINGHTVGRGGGNIHTNTAVGDSALYNNTMGHSNTASGYRSLHNNETGNCNTASGFRSLYNNETGWSNTASGYFALKENTMGYRNTASGFQSLHNTTTGNENTAHGTSALFYNTTGDNNTAIGRGALSSNTEGSNNTALGYYADVATDSLSNTTAIGFSASVSSSNSVVIGNLSVSSIGGYADWTNLSDGRFKTNVVENVQGLNFIMQLRPVTYNLDLDALAKFQNTPDSLRQKDAESLKAAEVQVGFIAQEVEAAANAVNFNFHGVDKPQNEESHYGLRYAEFVPPMVKAMQEQQTQIENSVSQEEFEQLRAENDALRARLDKLEQLLKKPAK